VLVTTGLNNCLDQSFTVESKIHLFLTTVISPQCSDCSIQVCVCVCVNTCRNARRPVCKVPYCLMIWNLLTNFSETPQHQIA
jgi:hypothetical protein